MKNFALTLLAATALGAISIGSATALPLNTTSPTLGQSDVQHARVVCNPNGRCYNDGRRNYRSVRRGYGPGYHNNRGYYASPDYGHYNGPRVGIGVGPFGFGVW